MNSQAQNGMADKDGVSARARYDDLAAAEGSMRSGDILWIADLTVLADNRDELLTTLRRFSTAKFPVAIQEGRTGRVSLPPHDGQHMAIEALARWSSANKKFGVLTAAEAGSLGGKSFGKRRRKQKLPKIEVARIWKDPALFNLSTDDIVAKVNEAGRAAGFKADWSAAMIYKYVGPRGVPAGPKMKPRK